MLRPGRSGLLCARALVLCGPELLRPEVLPSQVPPVPSSLLPQELLCAGLRAHVLCSGTDLLRSGTELLCRSVVLRTQVLPSQVPAVPPPLVPQELLRPGLL